MIQHEPMILFPCNLGLWNLYTGVKKHILKTSWATGESRDFPSTTGCPFASTKEPQLLWRVSANGPLPNQHILPHKHIQVRSLVSYQFCSLTNSRDGVATTDSIITQEAGLHIMIEREYLQVSKIVQEAVRNTDNLHRTRTGSESPRIPVQPPPHL